MKKLVLIAAFLVAGFSVNAQDLSFGLTAGYSNVAIVDGDSGSGFNVGAFVDFSVSDKFSVQPELGYTSSEIEDLSYNLFNINAMAKFHATEQLSILAGPQLGFASGDLPDILDELLGDDFTSLNFQLAAGASYDFGENFFAQARYAFQLNDHIKADGGGAQANVLSIGVGYKF